MKFQVPGRLSSAELKAMALRQQQQIDSQHQVRLIVNNLVLNMYLI